jgi:hypothetical protein
MKKIFLDKSNLVHLLVAALFAVLSISFMSPVLSGKVIKQGDVFQAHASQSEIRKFEKEHPGEYTGWTNSIFSGMPTYFIGGDYSKSVFLEIQKVIYYMFTQQGTFIFLYLIGMYILLLSLGIGVFPSILGSIGYAFFSYNILIIEAGHLSKVYALAFSPIVLAGLIIGFRGKPWLGAALFSLGLGLELNANHYQITYYTGLLILVVGLFELIRAVKQKNFSAFILTAVLSLVLGITAVLTNSARIWTSLDYTKESNRSGSELTKNDKSKGGLDKDYAFQWSYGKLESFTLLVPNFSGGSSGSALDNTSNSFKALTALGVDQGQAIQFVQGLPTYWGDQSFVGGTTYAGAIVLFLFILGLFFAEKRFRWPFLVSGVLCLLISWGGNFTILNNFLFDTLPMFNKFRAVSMILALFQLAICVVAALGLNFILKSKPTWEQFKIPFFVSFGITAGLSLVFWLIPSLFDFTAPNDSQFKDAMKGSFGENTAAINQMYTALLADRSDMLSSDALRSFIFIILAAVILWLFIKDKIKNSMIVGGLLSVLVLVDMWGVDKRYLSTKDFERKIVNRDDQFVPSATDLEILKDQSLSYRMFDVTANPFNNSLPSAYHKNIGGYSAVKLSRYADIIENQISKNNMGVLNMLNGKYFVTQGQNGQPVVQQNPAALGNAWFVKKVRMVEGATAEMKALDSLNTATDAVVDKSFSTELGTLPNFENTNGTIKLSKYLPNELVYEFESAASQIVIFSEIYYKGNVDWLATIDDKPVKHFRANYILRGLNVPAGKHTIRFRFDPVSVKEGQKYDKMASIGWLIMLVGVMVMHLKISAKKKSDTPEIV